ncbi:MAG: hypothetical protein Kow0090_12000 [Myxococcota bacterium]
MKNHCEIIIALLFLTLSVSLLTFASGSEEEGFVPSPEKRFSLAIAAERRGDYKEAEKHIRGVLSALPTWSKAHLELAAILIEIPESNPVEIEKALKFSEWSELNSARYHYLKGRYLERIGKLWNALKAYEKALEIRSSYESAIKAKERIEPLAVEEKESSAFVVAKEKMEGESGESAVESPQSSKESSKEEGKDRGGGERALAMISPLGEREGRTETASALFAEGKELMNRGRYKEALKKFKETTAIYPYWGLAQLELAVAHFLVDYDLEAIGAALKEAGKSEKKNPRYHYWRARYLESAGDEKRAISAYREALRLRPGIMDAQSRLDDLRDIVRRRGVEESGGKDAKRERRRFSPPDSASEALYESEDGKNTVIALERTRRGERAYQRGKKSLEEGDFAKAKGFFREAISELPWWGRPRIELARIYIFGGGSMEEAKRELAFVLQSDPFSWEAYYLLAMAFSAEGNNKEAKGYLKAALELAPEKVDIELTLARLHEGEGEFETAAALYRDVISRSAEHLDARVSLAILYERLKRFTDAEALWLELISLKPERAIYYQRISSLYEKKGDKEKARYYEGLYEKLESQTEKRNMRPLPESKDIQKK